MTSESKSIYVNSKGKKLEVAISDVPKKLNLNQTMEECKKLNDGWRLPTRDELEIVYRDIHKKNQGNFNKKGIYWTSSKSPDDWVLTLSFSDGKSNIDVEDSLNKVRFVRNI